MALGSPVVRLSRPSGLVQITVLSDRVEPNRSAFAPMRNPGVSPTLPLTVLESPQVMAVGATIPPMATVRLPLNAEKPPEPLSAKLVLAVVVPRQLTAPPVMVKPMGR